MRFAGEVKQGRFTQDTASFANSPSHAYMKRREHPNILLNPPEPTPVVELLQLSPLVSGVPEALAKWKKNELHFDEWHSTYCSCLLANENNYRDVMCALFSELAYFTGQVQSIR